MRATAGEERPPRRAVASAWHQPEISLVVPVFNGERHLPDLLASLTLQSAPALEIILVDDGSTDATPRLIEEAARCDRRVVVCTQPHCGVSAARNVGLDRARGRWIAFADGDDWLDPQALNTWHRCAVSGDLDLLIGNGFAFGRSPHEGHAVSPLLHRQPWSEVVSGADWMKHCIAAREWPHYVWLQLARRELIERLRSRFVESMTNHSDIVWTLELATHAKRVGFCRQPVYGYRHHTRSLSHNPSADANYRRANSYLQAIDRLRLRARECADRGLQTALVRHAGREVGSFFGIVRRQLRDHPGRERLLIQFSALNLNELLFADVSGPSDLWRAVSAWLVLQLIVRHARRRLPVRGRK